MKILITGAASQVGRALIKTAPADSELIALTHAQLDIADLESVRRCVADCRPTVVINAAAYTAVDRAEADEESAYRTNVSGAGNLARCAADVDARLLHLSTDFVFSGDQVRPYAPEDLPGPVNVYGTTKLAGEKAVQQLLPEGSAVLRAGWIYSATGQNFLTSILARLRQGQGVRVVSDQVGTPTSADSVSTMVWTVIAEQAWGGVLHWSDAGVASWYDFAVAIAEEAAHAGLIDSPGEVVPIRSHEYPTAARRPVNSVLDTRNSMGLAPGVQMHWRQNLRVVLGALAA